MASEWGMKCGCVYACSVGGEGNGATVFRQASS